jgi:Family of unknown function (DUF6599)
MRWISVAVCWLALVMGAIPAHAQAATDHPPNPQSSAQSVTHLIVPPVRKPLLPEVFDGWVAAQPMQKLTTAKEADPANAAALDEYGFTYGVLAKYKREDETLTMRALNFGDTSGAYGAYSYYRQNGWAKADIGTGGASHGNQVLFWKGSTVVDANFSRIGPMTAGEMRGIAAQLPTPRGNRSLAPPILAFLPQGSLEPLTTHYAMGPAGYAGSGGVLPPSLVGFDLGAETVMASYSLSSGPATLTIINYPTPQIATAQEAKIRAYIKAGSKAQPPWPKPLVNSDQASLEVRRSAVLVALVSGDAIPDQSHRLVELVHYEAQLVTIPAGGESEVEKTGKLLFGIAALVGIGSLAAILLGFFLGGGRALYRIARGKPASSVYDEEFIHLDLREDWPEIPKPTHGPHPNR